MIDPGQLRRLVIRPVLRHLDMAGAAAEALLLGTAAQESRLHWLLQVPDGPALGVYQIEPATHRDVYDNWLAYRPALRETVLAMAAPWPSESGIPDAEQMIGNLYYATAICRLIYRRAPEPLPEADDIEGLAAYYKRYFNTVLGKASEAEFVDNYRELITEG